MRLFKFTRSAIFTSIASITSTLACAQSNLSFDGPYVGAFVGSSHTSIKEQDMSWSNSATNGTATENSNVNAKGSVTGITYGYVSRLSSTARWISGIELSASFPQESIIGYAISPASVELNPIQSNTQIKSLFTIKPKMGYLVNQETMLYGTAGLAIAQVNRTLTQLPGEASGTLLSMNSQTSKTENRLGYVLGMGIERVITENISLKFEFNYVDFGTQDFIHDKTIPVEGNPANRISQSLKMTNTSTSLGLNYRF